MTHDADCRALGAMIQEAARHARTLQLARMRRDAMQKVIDETIILYTTVNNRIDEFISGLKAEAEIDLGRAAETRDGE